MASGTIKSVVVHPITFTGITTSTGVAELFKGYWYGPMYFIVLNIINNNNVDEGGNIGVISWTSPALGSAQTSTFSGTRIMIGQLSGRSITVRASKGQYPSKSACYLYFTSMMT